MNDEDWVGVPVPGEAVHSFTHRVLTDLAIPIEVVVPDEMISTTHPYVVRSLVLRATLGALSEYDASTLDTEQTETLDGFEAHLREHVLKDLYVSDVSS